MHSSLCVRGVFHFAGRGAAGQRLALIDFARLLGRVSDCMVGESARDEGRKYTRAVSAASVLLFFSDSNDIIICDKTHTKQTIN